MNEDRVEDRVNDDDEQAPVSAKIFKFPELSSEHTDAKKNAEALERILQYAEKLPK